MKIRYELTLDDIVAFHRYSRDHSPQVRRGMAWLLFAPAAASAAAGMVVAADQQDLAYLAGGVVVGLFWVGVCWLYVRWSFRATMRRLAKEGISRNWFCWHELELSDDMLVERSEHNTHATALRDLTSILSSDSHTFISLRPGAGGYVVPRRCVPDSEYHTFVDALRRAWEQAGTDTLPPAGRVNRAATTIRCRACGKPLGRGSMTCGHCGRTWWGPVVFRFAVAVAVKAGAVCGGLFLHNPWLKDLVAWGGSILAGYILLAVVHWAFVAFRMRKVVNRPVPEPSADPALADPALADPALIVQSGSLPSSLFALAITLGFVLVGNALSVELATCLGVAIFLFALLLVIAMVSSAVSSAGKAKLAPHQVAEPETWPAIPPVADGVSTADAVTTAARIPPAGLPTPKDNPGTAVKLRVLYAGAGFVPSFNLAVSLDGRWMGIGSLRRGFDARAETIPGSHDLQVRWGRVTQTFVLHLPQPGAYETELYYGKFWGRFHARSGQE